ncbi:MAG TPA: DUF559 domain-containing protein [bacterium]|nr:DUF559 domain-containing protein [bacterium]
MPKTGAPTPRPEKALSMRPDARAMIQRARRLRRTMSNIENRVWGFLRNGHLEGLKFRRQHPIGRYVVDFYCHERRLVIEIDGASHAGQHDADRVRAQWLSDHGFRVIRFANEDVLKNAEGVRAAIREACRGAGALTRFAFGESTSPKGRGERANLQANRNTPNPSNTPAGSSFAEGESASPKGRGERADLQTNRNNPNPSNAPAGSSPMIASHRKHPAPDMFTSPSGGGRFAAGKTGEGSLAPGALTRFTFGESTSPKGRGERVSIRASCGAQRSPNMLSGASPMSESRGDRRGAARFTSPAGRGERAGIPVDRSIQRPSNTLPVNRGGRGVRGRHQEE